MGFGARPQGCAASRCGAGPGGSWATWGSGSAVLRFEAAGLGCFVDTLRVLLAEVVWISGFDFDRMFSLLRRVGLLYGLGDVVSAAV